MKFNQATTKLTAAVLVLAASGTASATVYRAGFKQGRFWLNNQKVQPDLTQDPYAATSSNGSVQDWTLSAMMANVTGNAGAKATNPVSNKSWDWQNYYVYAYAGEMWMDAAQTYQLGGNFDDGSAILVDNEVKWTQGSTSGYNNWKGPTALTPTYTGWHPVKLFVWDYEGGKNVTCGALSAVMWNTNDVTTATPTTDWNKFEDNGSGSLFRAKVADTYFRVESSRATASGYEITVTSLATEPVTMKVFAGSADEGETAAGWTAESDVVEFAAGETKNIALAWTGSDVPVYRIYLTGEDSTLVSSKNFWEWSDARTFRFVPSVTAALAETSSTDATVSITAGYAQSLEGSSPDIVVTAYWGATNGGTDPSAWANSEVYAACQPSTFTKRFSCEVGGSCHVVFSAQIGSGEPVWSDVLTFGASSVTIAGPDSVYESDGTEKKIVLTRGENDGWQAITVGLSYTYSGNLAEDFTGLPESVTFAVGEIEKEFSFAVVDNAASDNSRNLVVAIAEGENYVAGTSSSVTVRILDDETESQVCEWTGAGDHTSWNDVDNWSTESVPTQIDTVLFGSHVTGDLTVTMVSDAEARLVRIETTYPVRLGAEVEPAVKAFSISAPTEGAHVYQVANTRLVDDVVYDIGTGAAMDLKYIAGTANVTKRGGGTLYFSNGGNCDHTGGTTVVEAGRVEFGGTAKIFGWNLVIGGCGEPATVYSTFNNAWNYNPMAGEYKAKFWIKDKGVLDLSRNVNSVQFQTMNQFKVDKGGVLKLGKTRVYTTGLDGEQYILEGEVEAIAGGTLMMQCGRLVVPASRSTMLKTDASVQVSGGWFHNASYEGQILWYSTRYTRFFVEDIEGVPVDFVLSGNVTGSNGDGFDKRDSGVMKLTSSNTYGGTSATEGMTRVHGGTLLLDNTEGSATGKSRVEVTGGNVLGGIGRTGGLADSPHATLNLTGNDTGYAVLHPGTINETTGAHLAGTLTAGSVDQSCATAFNNRSELKISVCDKGLVDCLAVYGKVTIAADADTKITLVADGLEPSQVKGGTYTILSATEGIEGEFARIDAPKGWRVNKVTEKVVVDEVETEVVKALTLSMAGRGFMVIIR